MVVRRLREREGVRQRPPPRDQPRELQQVEARARPDVLAAELHARLNRQTIQPDIGDAVMLRLQAEGEIAAERPVELARAADAADAGAMEGRGRALTRAGLDGPAVPEDGEPFALAAALPCHASSPATGAW